MQHSLFDASLLSETLQQQSLYYQLGVRPLAMNDYDRGFVGLLNQLTDTAILSRDHFMERFEQMKRSGTIFIVVIEDLESHKIVATATMVLEMKFIHRCGCVGHIEDIVVDKAYRDKGLETHLIEQLRHLGTQLGVYKLVLNCTQANVDVYQECGFERENVGMVSSLFPSNPFNVVISYRK